MNTHAHIDCNLDFIPAAPLGLVELADDFLADVQGAGWGPVGRFFKAVGKVIATPFVAVGDWAKKHPSEAGTAVTVVGISIAAAATL